MLIEEAACTVSPWPSREPRLTTTVDGMDFLRLVTGNVPGPMLFMNDS